MPLSPKNDSNLPAPGEQSAQVAPCDSSSMFANNQYEIVDEVSAANGDGTHDQYESFDAHVSSSDGEHPNHYESLDDDSTSTGDGIEKQYESLDDTVNW